MTPEHFDAIVIGSGFGGSVMTYRLAEAGLKVCLLERGKTYPPDSFARSPQKMAGNFWDPSEGRYGLFNVWNFLGSGALVSSGLGGGSLIYANVLIRKDEKWFVKEEPGKGNYEYWPVTRQDLDPHYKLVEDMMNVQQYPLGHKPYDETTKTLAMKQAAEQLGLQWMLPNLAVSFRRSHVLDPQNPDDASNPPLVGEPILETYPNYHNRTRSTCRLCGECDIGCNYGSKNTLDYNYISEAKRKGADIRTLCEVRAFEPISKGFTVRYVEHNPKEREGKKLDTRGLPTISITCDRLILSAGTFGTPFLLFKNRSAVPGISNRLGSHFSVNGDLLSFFLNSHETRDGKKVPRILNPSFGPVITSAIRIGDALDGGNNSGRGFYIEDGGNPNLLSWLGGVSGFRKLVGRLLRVSKLFLMFRLGLSKDSDFGAEMSDLISAVDSSKSSMPTLCMGRDYPNGKMTFEDGHLECDWNIKKSKEYYNRVIAIEKKIAKVLQADFVDNPPHKYLHQILTAHPLGGCPMGRNKDEGVVNSFGEVFDCPGLYIADGSIMPGPVGANPSLTIAALSNHFADHIIQEHKSKGATL